ncbi:MAG: hypothetical protein P8Z80_04525 [Pseudolabrys sp.]
MADPLVAYASATPVASPLRPAYVVAGLAVMVAAALGPNPAPPS